MSSLPFAAPDVAKAKQLLADAGYPNGFSFKITCSSTYEGGLAVAQVIQNELAKIGVTAQLDVVEWGVYIDKWVKRDFDAMVELRGGSGEPDRFLYRMLYSTGGVNNFLFKDADVDKLLDQGRTQTRPADRKATYNQLQTLISQKAPLVFLYSPNENQVLSAKVSGFKIVGNGSLYYLTYAQVARVAAITRRDGGAQCALPQPLPSTVKCRPAHRGAGDGGEHSSRRSRNPEHPWADTSQRDSSRSIPVLFGVSLIVFFLVRLIPGSALEMYMGTQVEAHAAADGGAEAHLR